MIPITQNIIFTPCDRFSQITSHLCSVADPEGGRGGTALSKIGQNLAKLAPYLPISASTPPVTDHHGSAPDAPYYSKGVPTIT